MLNNKVRKLINLCLVQGRQTLIMPCPQTANLHTKKSVEFGEILNPFLVFLENCEIEEIPET